MLAPEPGRKLRLALRRLEAEKGDIKSLEGKLAGYQRLQSGSHRVIFARRVRKGRPEIDCIFAEHRSLVYEVFTAALALQKTRKGKDHPPRPNVRVSRFTKG